MPILSSHYHPPYWFKNGHISTIYSGLLRKVNGVSYTRQRLTLSDGDFLDLDWCIAQENNTKLIVLLHGLEGSASRPYITGVAKTFYTEGYDVCAVNLRGCSGEDNLLYRSYHSGNSEDLEEILNYIALKNQYTQVILNGFSLGGNIILKYLGERTKVPEIIKAAVAVSVPCSLHDAMLQLHQLQNYPYFKKFKNDLLFKLKRKQERFPELISDKTIKSIKTLKDFDDVYTSKAHGFKDAMDYYQQCSCAQFLESINTPTLIINAKNDSFLGNDCYPFEAAETNSALFLETPLYGGHVGFYQQQQYYNESRSLAFVEEYIS